MRNRADFINKSKNTHLKKKKENKIVGRNFSQNVVLAIKKEVFNTIAGQTDRLFNCFNFLFCSRKRVRGQPDSTGKPGTNMGNVHFFARQIVERKFKADISY